MATESIRLTRAQAKEIQRALIIECITLDFQKKLWEAHSKAGRSEEVQAEARQALCLPVQGAIISRYGFEPTRTGVWKCTRALQSPELQADPDINQETSLLRWLVDPTWRMEHPVPPMAYDRFKPRQLRLDEDSGEGHRWVVVGGVGKGGIVVRNQKSLNAPECITRLSTGATVEQIELEAGRLHYKKIDGDGPDFGWVSVSSKGKPLVKCVDA